MKSVICAVALLFSSVALKPDSWGFVTSMDDKPAEHPKLVVVAANCP